MVSVQRGRILARTSEFGKMNSNPLARAVNRGSLNKKFSTTQFLALAVLSVFVSNVIIGMLPEASAVTPDFLIKKGSFTKSTGGAPASQSITGVGFQPEAVIFFWTRQTSAGTLAGIHSGYGFATGSSNERAIAIASDDNANTSVTGMRQSQTKCIIILSAGTPTLGAEAELTSFDSDGFTINWTTNEAEADIIHYIAIGGTELTNSLASSFTATAGAGSQSVTGVGFQPDFIMFLSIDSTTMDSNLAIGKANIGFAKSSTARGAVGVLLEDAQGTSDTYVRQRNDRAITELADTNGGEDMLSDFTSFDTDGFTINNSAADATTVHYLALKGGRYMVGSFGKSTGGAPVSQSVTGVGFKPTGLILTSKDLATNTGAVAEGRISFGASDGTTEGATWFHDKDNLATVDANQRTSTDKIAVHASQTTLNAEADLTSFDSDGFTLNWTTNNAVAEEIIYVAFGPSKFTETRSETLTSSDTSQKQGTKITSETLASSDAAVKQPTKSLTETLAMSDAINFAVQFVRVLNESLIMTDTNIRAFSKKLDDALTLSDVVAKSSSKLLTDTLSSSDAIGTIRDTFITLSDTLAQSDALAKSPSKALSDTLAESDTFSKSVAKTITLSDTLAESDTVATSNAKTITLSDTLAESDVLQKSPAKLLTDTLAESDTLQKLSAKLLTDTLAQSDTVATSNAKTITLSDTLAQSDAFSRSVAKTITLSDTLAQSDTLQKLSTKLLTDTLSSSDIVTPSLSKIITLSDTLTSSDTVSKVPTKLLIDALASSDTVTKSSVKLLTDTLASSDAVNRSITMSITLSDTLTSSDVLSKSPTKAFVDTLTESDSVTKSSIKLLSDTLTSSDVVSRGITMAITLSDTLASSDTVSRGLSVKTLQETLAVSDSTSMSGSRNIFLTETLASSDTIVAGKEVTLAETLAMSDAINTQTAFGTLGAGTLDVSDVVGLSVTTPSPPPSSTPVSVNILGSLGLIGGANMTFPNISTAGTVTVTMLDNVLSLPAELTLVPWIGSLDLVDISTTATFTGYIQLAVRYNDTGIESEESAISLMHFTGVNWEDITTTVDTVDNIVYGQTNSLSPFGIGINPAKLAGGKGGGSPEYEIIDKVPPEIVSHYYEPTTPFSGQELRVLAKINDDVAITKAYLLYFVNTPEPEFHQVSMVKHNAEYFMGTIPASDVRIVGMTYWIFAEDFGGNSVQSAVQNVEIQQSTQVVIPPKPSQKNLPSHVLEAIKPKIVEPFEQIEVLSMNSGSEINTFADTIIIRNTGNKTADNIRIMLSPEISKSFKLSDLSIKSIQPNENVTITLEVNGSPNKDMLGGLVGYTGNLIVMAEHVSPITLPVNIGGEESTYKDEYMDKVAAMAEQRYNKLSMLNSLLTKQDTIERNYEVTTSDGDDVITNPSDEIVIRNLSEKELKNVRIYLNNAGNAFLLEHKNIQTIEPNGQVSIKLISRMDGGKYSPKDVQGELLIVPSNDNPIQIPINILAQERKDSADEFEIRTLLGNDGIFTAHDKIIIKNLGNRTLDSVRLMLPVDLARVFVLSNDSFKNIAPNSEVTVDLKFRQESGEHKMGLLQNYQGELAIVSEHHRSKVIPVNITWNEISSKHFVIYSRNSEQDIIKANELITFLESNYQNVTARFGEVGKTTMYVTSTLEEFRMLSDSDYSDYSFADDTIFLCGCQEDVNSLGLKELVYKITFNKYPNYSNKEKFMLDGQNWLMDGIANYVASNMTDGINVKSQIDAFKQSPTSFVWYGTGSMEQYGATYTFFEYLQEKYGSDVIDKTLYYLGSGMISNHRCDTLEECAVLRGVYDVSGLDMDSKEKRNAPDIDILVKEWEDYVLKNYGIVMPGKDPANS